MLVRLLLLDCLSLRQVAQTSACVLTLTFLPGCSPNPQLESAEAIDSPDAPASTADVQPTVPADAAETQPNLDPSEWAVIDWTAKDLDHSLPENEAEVVVVDDGLQLRAYEHRGPVHFVLRKELVEDFEVTARIVQPSVEEVRSQGLQRPSPFSSAVGFRSAVDNRKYRIQLPRDRGARETTDVTIRASGQYISFRTNEENPRIMPRHQLEPGCFFLQTQDNNIVSILDIEVRDGLEPDAELIAAGDQFSKSASSGNGGAMPPPGFGAGPPPGFGPGFPMPGSGPPGMGGPGDAGGRPPAPSRLEPLLSQGEWSVRRQGNDELDSMIEQDLRLESANDGLTVVKTAASGGFWLLRKIESSGDFTATCRVSLPSMAELAPVAGPGTLLAVGAHSSGDADGGVIGQAPPPMPSGPRTFELQVRRQNGRVTLDINGAPLGGSVMTDGDVLMGLYVRGGIRFTIDNFHLTPPADEKTGSESEEPSGEEPTATPRVTRVWTDAGGTRKIEATFLELDGDRVRFRLKNGTEAASPLSNLSEADQAIVRELAGS